MYCLFTTCCWLALQAGETLLCQETPHQKSVCCEIEGRPGNPERWEEAVKLLYHLLIFMHALDSPLGKGNCSMSLCSPAFSQNETSWKKQLPTKTFILRTWDQLAALQTETVQPCIPKSALYENVATFPQFT